MSDDFSARLARVEQRVTDHDTRLNSMMPVVTTVAALSERVQQVRDDFADFRERIDERDQVASKERKAQIRWAITLTVTILASLAGLAVAIITSAHP